MFSLLYRPASIPVARHRGIDDAGRAVCETLPVARKGAQSMMIQTSPEGCAAQIPDHPPARAIESS